MPREHTLVSPEAVPLDLPEATVGSRGVALLIDWTLLAIFFFVLSLAAANAPRAQAIPEWVVATAVLIVVFLVWFGYPIAFETAWSGGGRTPGKAVMGLRVVTVEGAPVRFRHAAIRAAVGLIDFTVTFGLGAVLSSMLSRRHQRLGDMVAGTVVLRERTGSSASEAHQFTVPPAAAGMAADLDTTALSPRDYSAVRAYLLRADSLPDGRRVEVGRQLLDALASRLGHLPVHDDPQVVLQAVAARYQERHRTAAGGLSSTP